MLTKRFVSNKSRGGFWCEKSPEGSLGYPSTFASINFGLVRDSNPRTAPASQSWPPGQDSKCAE